MGGGALGVPGRWMLACRNRPGKLRKPGKECKKNLKGFPSMKQGGSSPPMHMTAASFLGALEESLTKQRQPKQWLEGQGLEPACLGGIHSNLTYRLCHLG